MDANEQKLKPNEKFNERAKAWKSTDGIKFADASAEQTYQRHVQMLLDVISLKKPERIPVCPNMGFYPFVYAGVTPKEAMYDYEKLGFALMKFHADFLPDSMSVAPIYGPGRVFDTLDYKLYRWPGRGLPDTSPHQCIEDEYMHADEYDLLINDPSNFFLRRYLPRVFGAFDSMQSIDPLTDILELPFAGGAFIPFGLPEVVESLQKLIKAGQQAHEWIHASSAVDNAVKTTLGLSALIGGFTKAPFDTLGDTLRGTRAVMLDKFRRPGKVLTAVEKLVPIAIEMGVRSATRAQNPVVFIPLHKGADGFMSDDDFKTFYWPTLKALILGLIEQGLVPYMFVEGGFNKRLDVITDPDIPAGTTIWMFDQTDMKEVKKRFTGWACFGGNLPVSLLKVAKPDEVSAHVKRLIDEVGQDGGYILSSGAVIDDAKEENLHALIDTGKQYGVM